MHVGMHVCMYVCLYARLYACMYACMNECKHYVQLYMYVCLYVCMYVCKHACMYILGWQSKRYFFYNARDIPSSVRIGSRNPCAKSFLNIPLFRGATSQLKFCI